MSRAALFISLLTISAYIKIPLGLVPMTLQTLVVLLIGLLLTKQEAVLCIFGYIIMGLIGIPVFSGGGGVSYIFTPTFGYILGFACAIIFLSKTKHSNYVLLRCLLAMLLIYILGIVYFIVIQYTVYGITYSVSWIITSLFLVYLPGDLLSCVLAKWIDKRLQ